MSPSAAEYEPLIGLVVATLVVLGLLVSGRLFENKRQDLAMMLGLLTWLTLLLSPDSMSVPKRSVDAFMTYMAYQLCVAACCELALTGAQVAMRRIVWIWRAQLIGGGVFLLSWAGSGHDAWIHLWQSANWLILGSITVFVLTRWTTYRGDNEVKICVLTVLLLLCCASLMNLDRSDSWVGAAGTFAFPAVLIPLWLWVTARIRTRARMLKSTASDLQRQRIAQDVHDGIGSHLVAILSSLDIDNPEQRNLALSLEQCLFDLKVTVDSVSDDSPVLIEGLATLRYRIQPSLHRMGVQLYWDIQDHPILDRLPPVRVKNSLRIVQEAVSNVMRHADASRLTIACWHVPQSNSVKLEVQDDGRGMSAATDSLHHEQSVGKGLSGMKRRAEESGVCLSIKTAVGGGTTVQLEIPISDDRIDATGPWNR